MKKYNVTLLTQSAESCEEFVIEANNSDAVYALAKKIFYHTDLLGNFNYDDDFSVGIRELDDKSEVYCSCNCDDCEYFEHGKCCFDDYEEEEFDIEELFYSASDEQQERILSILN